MAAARVFYFSMEPRL